MFEIGIYYAEKRVHLLAEPLKKLLTSCGLSFRMEVKEPNLKYKGGSILLRHLRLLKSSQIKRGYQTYDNKAYLMMNYLMHRLLKNKPFRGLVWFPYKANSARVRCGRILHNIHLSDKGSLRLEHHPKEGMEDDRAMSVLACSSKYPRCIRLYDVWQKCNRIENDLAWVNIPRQLMDAYMLNKIKKQYREIIRTN